MLIRSRQSHLQVPQHNNLKSKFIVLSDVMERYALRGNEEDVHKACDALMKIVAGDLIKQVLESLGGVH
jgi:hypothetical protein